MLLEKGHVQFELSAYLLSQKADKKTITTATWEHVSPVTVSSRLHGCLHCHMQTEQEQRGQQHAQLWSLMSCQHVPWAC